MKFEKFKLKILSIKEEILKVKFIVNLECFNLIIVF